MVGLCHPVVAAVVERETWRSAAAEWHELPRPAPNDRSIALQSSRASNAKLTRSLELGAHRDNFRRAIEPPL